MPPQLAAILTPERSTLQMETDEDGVILRDDDGMARGVKTARRAWAVAVDTLPTALQQKLWITGRHTTSWRTLRAAVARKLTGEQLPADPDVLVR